MNLIHKTMRDVEVNGYRLKEGTAIVPQISTVLFDEKIFPNPEQFRPERFLDENGHLKRCDQLAPFGMGKR
jgi:cytochrome P450 family 33